ncbi:MAG: class I SAM-dependent methyltransferase [Anaerolineales bacterium]
METGLLSRICLGGLAFLILWYLLVRRFRHRHPFPIPYFLVPLIDNPLRRAAQPPRLTIERLGLRAGMQVLEIGPGRGTYTLAAARLVGPLGSVIALEIDPRITERLKRRVTAEQILNIRVVQGDAQELDFENASFDALFLITVMGEIPDPARALSEFRRVLKPGGTLGLSELLLDPDYEPPERVIERCREAGFVLIERSGNWMHYNLVFQKP